MNIRAPQKAPASVVPKENQGTKPSVLSKVGEKKVPEKLQTIAASTKAGPPKPKIPEGDSIVISKADPKKNEVKAPTLKTDQAVQDDPKDPSIVSQEAKTEKKKTALPEGSTNPDGSVISNKKESIKTEAFGKFQVPPGSKFGPDGSVEFSEKGRVKLDNFPLDVPSGSTIDPEGNLKFPDGTTVQKDGQVRDKEGNLIPPQDLALKDGQIQDLRGLSPEEREKKLNDGFEFKDKDSKPLPTPKQRIEDKQEYKDRKGNPIPPPKKSESNKSGRYYDSPYNDPEANRQYNEYQNNRTPERSSKAQEWQRLNPTELFDPAELNGDLASRLVANVKTENTGSGRCYEAVANAIEKSGIKWPLPSQYDASAYMFAQALHENPQHAAAMGLKEVSVPSDANAIPTGAVCVWDPGAGGVSSTHGHIAIGDGQGSQYYGVGAREFWSMPNYMFVPSKSA